MKNLLETTEKENPLKLGYSDKMKDSEKSWKLVGQFYFTTNVTP